MPTLRSHFAIFTDGAAPQLERPPPLGVERSLLELPKAAIIGPNDELFGPHVAAFRRFEPRRAFVLGLTRAVRSAAGSFFDDAKRELVEATRGIPGFGLDVLRLWPFELDASSTELTDETLAEDIFTVAFRERGEHGFRAETFGLSKLDQRELTFEFSGQELFEEAVDMCGRLVDWLLEQGARVEPEQAMSFGFDRLRFLGPRGGEGAKRVWEPELVSRLLPPQWPSSTGILEVRALDPLDRPDEPPSDLSQCLFRALEQRLLVEELDLTADPPRPSSLAAMSGSFEGLVSLVAIREQNLDRRDSGWRFERTADDGRTAARSLPLSELVKRSPALAPYLALPWGVRLEWDAWGAVKIDTSRARAADEGSE